MALVTTDDGATGVVTREDFATALRFRRTSEGVRSRRVGPSLRREDRSV